MEPLGADDPQELGPYRLVARLGAGGMGRVYLAASAQGQSVAVKAIRPEMMGDRGFRIRFRREVGAARAVGGRYTVPVLDADPDAATPWLATAYVPGPTLAEAVAEHGPLPVESVLALGAGIAEALIAVQAAGLVHRDLKPSNVLLAADGPRVIDFGIVRASDGYDLTRSGALFGSFEYMCPEQATGDPVGPEGDVFALGSVLAFAASGHAPFTGSAAATLLYQVVHGTPDLTDVPEPLDKIISLCLARDPRLRITPDRLAAACAPGGVDQVLGDGWLPPQLASSIARRAAAVTALSSTQRASVRVPVANGSAPHVCGQGRAGSTQAARSAYGSGSVDHSAYGFGAAGDVDGVRADTEPPEREPSASPAPDRPTSPGHRRSLPQRGLPRRTVLAAAGTTTAAVGTTLLLTRGKGADGQAAKPLGPAPKPAWTYRGGPLLQAPAVFTEGTALLKSRPGDMICLDLKDGTRPKWVYEGISQSPTPVALVYGAAVALGEGATVIGVDPANGTERFTLDFGTDFRFDTLLGSYDDGAVSVIGLRLERQSEEQGVATSTNTVFGVDLAGRRAKVIPISPEDVGVRLSPVILPGSFIYVDGLHNVTVRDTGNDGAVRWRHPLGYDLRPGLAVLGRTVFAIGRELKAMNLSTGKLRWRAKPERGQFASLGVVGSTVYVTGTDPSGVYAFNAASGSKRWFCPTPRLNVNLPVTAGPEKVYVPAYKNRNGFYAIDAARGRLLWNFTDGRETGVNDWQLACDRAGYLVAQHYDRTYGLPAT
ncbi:PQQ-binding-like beta-propeller repeat protein [Streptomyces phyllanthi]|uniref:Protein kinase n=1 Tax=Streptomyces phyllanthi TaxID=1803180 RepID=A0A5N8WCT1_9ACTN|nr:PQQ-binding-like beta-propeller repeat protein [Streptomyces phyllanthi]MPY45280.1 protein kinase [Streptomyces phyllanthi]